VISEHMWFVRIFTMRVGDEQELSSWTWLLFRLWFMQHHLSDYLEMCGHFV